MIEHKNNKKQQGQEGQALLFVIVALTIALSVGVSVSLRTLSSISRVTTTDTASRVLSAAEGGLEHFLSYSTSELSDATDICDSLDYEPDDFNEDCVIHYDPVETDNIEARAVVMVEPYYGDPDENGAHTIEIEGGDFATINLNGYNDESESSLTICWEGDSDIYYTLVAGRDVSDWSKGIVCGDITGSPGCFSDVGDDGTRAEFDLDGCPEGYKGIEITVPGGFDNFDHEKSLSIVPLNSNIIATFVPHPEGFGILGYRITSRGELIEDRVVKTVRVVRATRSLPYLPASFTFGLFSDGGIINEGTQMSDLGY